MPAPDCAHHVVTVRLSGSAVVREHGDVWSAPTELRLALDERCLDMIVTVAGMPALRYASDACDVVAAWRTIARAVQDYDESLHVLSPVAD
jgi:hypothetical protein